MGSTGSSIVTVKLKRLFEPSMIFKGETLTPGWGSSARVTAPCVKSTLPLSELTRPVNSAVAWVSFSELRTAFARIKSVLICSSSSLSGNVRLSQLRAALSMVIVVPRSAFMTSVLLSAPLTRTSRSPSLPEEVEGMVRLAGWMAGSSKVKADASAVWENWAVSMLNCRTAVSSLLRCTLSMPSAKYGSGEETSTIRRPCFSPSCLKQSLLNSSSPLLSSSLSKGPVRVNANVCSSRSVIVSILAFLKAFLSTISSALTASENESSWLEITISKKAAPAATELLVWSASNSISGRSTSLADPMETLVASVFTISFTFKSLFTE